MEKQQKELDLVDLLVLFTGWCQKIGKFLSKGILLFTRFNIKNWILLLCFLIVGFAMAKYKSKQENRKHKTEFIIESKGSDNFILKDMIDDLADLLKQDTDESIKRFCSLLKLTEDEAEQIYEIDTYFAIDLNNNGTIDFIDYEDNFEEDSLNVRKTNLVDVVIKVKGEFDLIKLQSNLIDYLCSDKELIFARDIWVNNQKVLMNSLTKEIAVLDSLRTAGSLTKIDYVDGRMVMSQTSHHEDMLLLQNKKIQLEETLAMRPAVVIPYTKARVKNVESNIFIVFKWIVFCYVFGLFVALLLRKRKNIFAFIKEQRES